MLNKREFYNKSIQILKRAYFSGNCNLSKVIFFSTLVFAFVLISIPLVSSQYGRFYDFSPWMFIQNEWMVFIGIFFILFSLINLSLNKLFNPEKEGKRPMNRGVIGIIAFFISLFCASVLTQRAFWYGYAGDSIITFVYIVLTLVFILFIVALFQKARSSMGTAPAIFSILFFIWLVFRFFIDPYDFFSRVFSSLNLDLYMFYDMYDFLTTDWLFLVILFGFIISLYFSKKGKRIETI